MPWHSGVMLALTQDKVLFVTEVVVGLVLFWFLLRFLGFLTRCLLYLIWFAALATALVWIWAELAG